MSSASLIDTLTLSTGASTSTSQPTESGPTSSRISPSSSRSAPSSSELLSAQNPSAEPTTSSSIRSTADPHSPTSRSYVELSSQSTTTATTTVSRVTEAMSSSSSQTSSPGASTSDSSSRTNSASSFGNISADPSSVSASTMSSGSSMGSSTSSTSSLSSIAPPSTTRDASSESSSSPTTTLISSSTDTPTSIQSTSSIESTPALEPTMTSGPDPGAMPTYPPVVHNVLIDSGTCADMGKPKVVIASDGRVMELESLGSNRYNVAFGLNEWGAQAVSVFLEDDGERCGSQATCATIFITSDPTTLTLAVMRSGDRGVTMYPFSFWTDGGELLDGTPADSEAHKYNCWGWPARDCPFSSTYPTDPDHALTSTTPNATAYIMFCPPDGPPASSVGLNPDPPPTDPQPEVTNIILTMETTAPVSTFVQVITLSRQHGSAPATRTRTPTLTPFESMMTVPAPTASSDSINLSHFQPDCLTSTCIVFNTFIPLEETTTVPLGTSLLATVITTTPNVEPISTVSARPTLKGEPTIVPSTFISIGTTSIVPVTDVTPTPTRPTSGNGASPMVTSRAVVYTDSVHSKPTTVWEILTLPESGVSLVAVPTTITDSVGMPIATSILGAQVIPTFSAITDSRGSIISTVPYNLTITAPPPTPTPPPQTLYTLTSWTTWITVNGSTVPAIAGQVGVLTTVPVTYALEPDTTIAVGVLSSISVESTRTALPSVTAQAQQDQVASGRGGKV
ncbi:hypothetical protein FS749_015406, partial [Ceratobasidium sp. UAMH 11750]